MSTPIVGLICFTVGMVVGGILSVLMLAISLREDR